MDEKEARMSQQAEGRSLYDRIINSAGTVSYVDDAGDSMDTAVVVLGARSSSQGIQAEYDYLAYKFGRRGVGYEPLGQALIGDGKGEKYYDAISVRLCDGTEKEIFFDITEFYGMPEFSETEDNKPVFVEHHCRLASGHKHQKWDVNRIKRRLTQHFWIQRNHGSEALSEFLERQMEDDRMPLIEENSTGN